LLAITKKEAIDKTFIQKAIKNMFFCIRQGGSPSGYHSKGIELDRIKLCLDCSSRLCSNDPNKTFYGQALYPCWDSRKGYHLAEFKNHFLHGFLDKDFADLRQGSNPDPGNVAASRAFERCLKSVKSSFKKQ